MLISSLIPSFLVVEAKGSCDREVAAITDHSGKVAPQSLYFAIRGGTFDGHEKAGEALRSGAVAAVVERKEIFDLLDHVILVRSTRQAWAHASSRWQGEPSKRFSLVGVTGTNGKTTTAYLLNQVWERLGLTPGLVGTIECRIGQKKIPSELTTPGAPELQSLFKEMALAKVTHAAMEVSSIALDQFRTSGTHFTGAIFTNLTQDHLDYHGDFEKYFEAKRRLFTEYSLQWTVWNADDPYAQRLASAIAGKSFSFGLSSGADFKIESHTADRKGSTAFLHTPQGNHTLRLTLIGLHNIYNALGVIATCHALGLPLPKVIEALADCPGAPGRLERVTLTKKEASVFVDYAHTPDALENVLRALNQLRGAGPGRIITVFGCGGDRDRGKRPLMAKVASDLSDIVIATSDNPRTEDPDAILDEIATGIPEGREGYYRERLRRSAIEKAIELAQDEDLVLIAGKGHEDYQIIGKEKHPFDDRAVVRDYDRADNRL